VTKVDQRARALLGFTLVIVTSILELTYQTLAISAVTLRMNSES
jgi:hypothetical protein